MENKTDSPSLDTIPVKASPSFSNVVDVIPANGVAVQAGNAAAVNSFFAAVATTHVAAIVSIAAIS